MYLQSNFHSHKALNKNKPSKINLKKVWGAVLEWIVQERFQTGLD